MLLFLVLLHFELQKSYFFIVSILDSLNRKECSKIGLTIVSIKCTLIREIQIGRLNRYLSRKVVKGCLAVNKLKNHYE